MKILIWLLLFAAALGQKPSDVSLVTFDRADTEHCKVIVVEGKPLLESTYAGMSVAVGMPENKGNGEFSVFVSIDEVGTGTAEVVPQEFSALYSDPAHTRFPFFDKAAHLGWHAPSQASGPEMPAANSRLDPATMRAGLPAGSGPASDGISPVSGSVKNDGPSAASRQPTDAARPLVFLPRATIKQGSRVTGVVYFRKPKGAKLKIKPTDMLDEIDIPINGVVFRF